MMPVPYWLFDGCRVKYRLRNRVLSKDVDLLEESIGMHSEEDQLEGGVEHQQAVHDPEIKDAKEAASELDLQDIHANKETGSGPRNEEQREAGSAHKSEDRSKAKKATPRKVPAMLIDPQWPISTLMKINEVPYQLLLDHALLFNYSYTHPNFKETLRALSWLAQQEAVDMGLPARPLSVYSNRTNPAQLVAANLQGKKYHSQVNDLSPGAELDDARRQEVLGRDFNGAGQQNSEAAAGRPAQLSAHADATHGPLLENTAADEGLQLSEIKPQMVGEDPKNRGSHVEGFAQQQVSDSKRFLLDKNIIRSLDEPRLAGQRSSRAAEDDDEVKVEQSDAEPPSPKIGTRLEGGEHEVRTPNSRRSRTSNGTNRMRTNMRYSNNDVEEDEVAFDEDLAAADGRLMQGDRGDRDLHQPGDSRASQDAN